MAAVLPTLIRTGAVALGSAIAGIGYAALVERNAFVLREVTMPVLTPGSTPLRVLHISDLHMLPNQHRKQAWLRELASWEPDLVVNTGDNLAHPKAVPAVVQTLSDLLSRPGVFVFGSNDYFGPRLKNPMNYLTSPDHRVRGAALPWQDLRAAFTERGWLDLTHTRREFEVAGLHIAAAGAGGRSVGSNLGGLACLAGCAHRTGLTGRAGNLDQHPRRQPVARLHPPRPTRLGAGDSSRDCCDRRRRRAEPCADGSGQIGPAEPATTRDRCAFPRRVPRCAPRTSTTPTRHSTA